MNTATMKKPVRLEINNSGAWKLLGTFEGDDGDTWELVFEHASALFATLGLGNARHPDRPVMRVSKDDQSDTTSMVLAEWTSEGGWRDAVTGDAL